LTMKKVVEDAASVPDLKTKRKAQQLQLQQTKEALKSAKMQSADVTPRAFKRPAWADADRMTVFLDEKQEEIDVTIEDSWNDVKDNACDAFGVTPAGYRMQIIQEMPADKIVKNKARPAKVGELCVWDSVLRLTKETSTSGSSSSSISSKSP
jgi:hypothetical protein